MAVSAGIWKYVFSHADGEEVPMEASLVSVTVSDAFAPTTSALDRTCAVPEVEVA
jgi:hypothetical protein